MGMAELGRVKSLERSIADSSESWPTGPRQGDAPGCAARKGLRLVRRCEMARHLIDAFRVPTRRACEVVCCNRATFSTYPAPSGGLAPQSQEDVPALPRKEGPGGGAGGRRTSSA